MEFVKFTNPFGATLSLAYTPAPTLAKTAQAEKPAVNKDDGKQPNALDSAALVKLLTGPATSIAKLQNELRDVVEAISDQALKDKLTKHIESIGAAGKDLLEEAGKALGVSAASAVAPAQAAAQAAAATPTAPATAAATPITGDLSAGNLNAPAASGIKPQQ